MEGDSETIQQVCRALKQWSIEGPPRNPRKAAGDLASLLEESQQKQTQEGCEAVSESAAAAVQCEELRSQLAELEKELAMAADEKAKLLEEQRRAEEAAAMLRADLDTRDAARRAIVPAAAPTAAVSDATLRQRLESLSSHLSSVLAPVSAACRTRPLCSYKEPARGGARALSVEGQEITVEDAQGRSRKFKIDRVLEAAPQEELFVTAAPWVEHAALGGSSCVFAYGATGSGKTHSILGSSNSAGLAQHALRRLLETGEVRVSMLEVYCEQIRDLLATEGPRAPLQCSRRDGQGRMVLDCVEVLAGEVVEAERLLQRGFAHRATEGTLCNDSSSRSHVVLTVQAVSGTGRLVLVDLAGSENVQRSGADEDAKLLAEAKAINRSLSALADVVEATAKQQSFVPYRNSRLTMLLEEALTVSRVLLLVHVSPFLRDATDTAHSLAFASRVRAVDFGAQRLRQEQEDRARAAQQRSQQEARQLQQQLDQAKRELAEAQKAQSELKQQSSTLVEQLRERQRELIREQELRAKAEESAREFRLGTPRGLSGLSGLGGPAAPRALSPSRKRREKFGERKETPFVPPLRRRENEAVDLDKLEVKVEAPALRAPLVDRTNEDRSNEDRAALKKEVLALASPNRAKIEDVPVTPERLINCFVEPEVAAQRGIFRSPERNDPKEADRAVAREPPREPPAQVRPVLKRVPTDFKTRLLKKQEFGASLGGKRVTFAEEQTACSPPRWYLDLLEHDQEKKLEEPKASKPPRALTPPLRRNKEAPQLPQEGNLPRWR